MAVYYSSNVDCYHQQEPIYLNHQQQQASSSSVRNEMVFISPTTGEDVVAGLQNLNRDVAGDGALSSSGLSFHDGQGLSLTLGNQISPPSFHHQQYHHMGFTSNPTISVKETPPFNVEEKSNETSGYAALYNNYRFNETSGGFTSSVLRSRYLKPAQSLLDEVVSVNKELNQMRKKKKKKKGQDFNNGSKDTQEGRDLSIELSTTERQELQNKKNQLLTMVDEVDKRYNQYYHQMEALASSFEIVAGFGSSKPYTSVALNKISRNFRSLRDTVKEQIQIIKEKLGEKEESLDEQQQGGGERIPRLRYLDQRLRQQRAFHQQLGMVRPSWRPQRGLPENSVSALRAWLFEHFLHPYPKDSEKMMLAKQTGLSKNQVANWFINARVRLWKPMIEDIYKEEFGDESELQISKSSHQEPNITNQEDSSSQQQPGDNSTSNNNLTYPSGDTTSTVFSSEPKPDRVSGNDHEPQQQQMNRSGDYETLMNYHQGFGMEEEDYRYIGGDNQQDSRFSNAHHHLHDFVV